MSLYHIHQLESLSATCINLLTEQIIMMPRTLWIQGHILQNEKWKSFKGMCTITKRLISATNTAISCFTACLLCNGTGMWCVSGRYTVSLPYIHLRAARSVLAKTGVVIIIRRSPSNRICLQQSVYVEKGGGKIGMHYFSINKLYILRTLCITVTSPVFGAGFVGAVL